MMLSVTSAKDSGNMMIIASIYPGMLHVILENPDLGAGSYKHAFVSKGEMYDNYPEMKAKLIEVFGL